LKGEGSNSTVYKAMSSENRQWDRNRDPFSFENLGLLKDNKGWNGDREWYIQWFEELYLESNNNFLDLKPLVTSIFPMFVMSDGRCFGMAAASAKIFYELK
jgi:hypothetical protein